MHSKKIFIKWNFIINFFSSISFCQIQYMYKLLSAHIRWLLCCSLYTCRFAIKLGFIKNVFAFCEQWALHACIVNIANIVLGPTEFIISQVYYYFKLDLLWNSPALYIVEYIKILHHSMFIDAPNCSQWAF